MLNVSACRSVDDGEKEENRRNWHLVGALVLIAVGLFLSAYVITELDNTIAYLVSRIASRYRPWNLSLSRDYGGCEVAFARQSYYSVKVEVSSARKDEIRT